MIGHGEATSDDGKTGVIPRVVSGNGASADGPTLAGSALITEKGVFERRHACRGGAGTERATWETATESVVWIMGHSAD